MNSKLSIRFYLNLLKARGDRFPIYLRLTHNRKKAEMATKYFLEEREWDSENERCKKNIQVNEELASIESKVYEIIRELERNKKSVTAHSIKNYLTEKDKINFSLIEYYQTFIARLLKAGEVAEVTVRMYKNTKKHLQNFLREKKKTEDIPLDNVDFKFLSDFDLFLLNHKPPGFENGLERNTVSKHHSRFKTVLIRAMKDGYIHKNPYWDMKLKKIPSSRTFLTEEELEKITKHGLANNQSLIKVRDIFIFSVYTGLRFEDAQQLTTDRISKDKKGNHTLQITQEKTNEVLSIPLLKPALAIIDKYKDSPERKVFKSVLPRISNQKLNSYLKVIADLVGIGKHLSHHVARHTCATTVLLSNEVPIEVVSKWLGHTNIKTTQIYAKISNSYLQKVATNIDEKIK